ncbi:Hsp70 family protein [Planctomycetes bacterium K23_9]|uniref:Chaperone protein DnaK n=1 Tax=Stieleria marina TaxID=1930275 RepID=A0A517NRH7_9BACT|nr:Chaperone protein DnaK [Planctomycetes bacterium K23_9]
MSKSNTPAAIGIDLGTTFSAVAFLDNRGRPETIRSAEGDMTTPSAVFFDRKNPIVGTEAVEAGMIEPERLAQYAKRDVGEAAYEKTIRGETFPPEVIQALILKKLKADAELKLGEITKAVVTVPAFFNEPCRKATQDAGRLAGLDVLDIINEPTAAAITYGIQQGFLTESGRSKELERVLVYDLGGGTFDVTVMEIQDAKYNTLATAGDVYLGGIDWDRRIVDFIAEAFHSQHGIDPRDDMRGEQELVRKANQAKHALTQRESVSISFAFQDKRLRIELTQAEFAKLTEDLVERTLMTVQLVLDDAKIGWSDLTRLILVGGSTRMPMIRDELHRLSGIELDRSLSPDEAVSHGAALYAGMLIGAPDGDHANISVTNVNSNDLGILAVDPKTSTPRRQIMIPRNSSLPAQKRTLFRTHSDNQINVKIVVVEGGDDKGVNATNIGKCIVDNLPPELPKGTQVDVRFDYGQDGRLTVSATLPAVDRKVQMTLDRAAGLSDKQIESWKQRIADGLADPPELPQDDSEQPQASTARAKQEKPTIAKAIVVSKATKTAPKTGINIQLKTDDTDASPEPKGKTTAGKPNSKKPSPKRPIVKRPAPKNAAQESAVSDSEAGKPTIKKPTLQKPVVKKPTIKQPAAKATEHQDSVAKAVSTDKKKAVVPAPKLKVDALPTTAKIKAKPGEPDFSKLMGLGGESKRASTKPGVPVIITTNGKDKTKTKTASPKKSSDQ